ncbi:MAG TPA: outer membrane beta-barrel protein [Caulobacteraceae bacterium]|nr:outer membrane beta-barrel protein [Caulobacteraceae bacterium]
MKFVVSAAVAAIALAASAATAQAETNWYASAGYSNFSTEGFADHDLDAVTVRVGTRFLGFLGAEAEGSFGMGAEDIGGGLGVKLNDQFAGYLVGAFPVSENLEVFARVGYGSLSLRVVDQDDSPVANGEGNSMNYGVGGAYFFDGLNGIRGDYTRHDFEDGEADVLSVSYVRRF